jgi:polyhydroxyalkanoate synthesis regulator phasin
VIDIVRDYTAIGVGTVQAASARIAELGRDTATLVTNGPGASGSLRLFDPRTHLTLARDVGRQIVAGDVEAVISRIGLAKKSELHAVRVQLQRLERRVADGRAE